VFRAGRKSELKRLLLTTRLEDWYWRIAPSLYQCRRHLSPDHVDPPINPFRLFFVDPNRITRFTGREFPVWTDRWEHFGAVMDDDWDQRSSPPIRPDYRGTDPSLYLAERFSETPVHEGLVEHFINDVPWDELDFVQTLVQEVQSTDTYVWQDCTTPEEIYQYSRSLDELYEDMRDRGCLSMRELNARENRQMTFPEIMENEILVDVGRTGELLFVTGRHRLSLAKILGLDRVPVAVVVRHSKWLARDEHGRPAETGDGKGVPHDHELPSGSPFDVPW
jgi:hypothetical protein